MTWRTLRGVRAPRGGWHHCCLLMLHVAGQSPTPTTCLLLSMTRWLPVLVCGSGTCSALYGCPKVVDQAVYVCPSWPTTAAVQPCEREMKPMWRLFRHRTHVLLITRSTVAVIADRTVYDVRYSYRPLAGMSVVSMSSYSFTVSNWSLLLMPGRLFSRSLFLWLNDTSYSKSVWRSK